MNHDQSWRTLRLKHGLRWRGQRPTLRELGIDGHGILFLLFILACYAFVGSIEYADAQHAEQVAASARAARDRGALIACLNGGAPGLYTTDEKGIRHYIICPDPYIITDENVARRKTS